MKTPISLASIERSRATTGIMTLSDTTLSETMTWIASMEATGTKTRFIAARPPHILYRSALFRIVLRRMRIEATSTMMPSTLIAPRPAASASA